MVGLLPALAMLTMAFPSTAKTQVGEQLAFSAERFITFTTHPARQGNIFEAKVSAFVNGGSNQNTKFSIVNSSDNGSWARISPDGVIRGTPQASATETTLEIEASSPDATTQFEVVIPVRAPGQALVENLKIMTYNLWMGGTRVNDYHAKQVRFLAASGADIVGVQESTGDHATRLGDALGWYSWQGRDVGFISRYPIVDNGTDKGYAGSVLITIEGDIQVKVWNAHLGHEPYGPYDFCFDKMDMDKVMEREAESGRTSQIIDIVSSMHDDLENSENIPVILLGDTNAPSHLDYTEALRDRNCGYANVSWPSSVHPTDAGLVDTFRVAHPNPATKLGITWSPIDLKNSNGQPEPLDRIDFIYHKGAMEVVSSENVVVGKPAHKPDHEDNEWTSDHTAVLTTFKLASVGQSGAALPPIHAGSEY